MKKLGMLALAARRTHKEWTPLPFEDIVRLVSASAIGRAPKDGERVSARDVNIRIEGEPPYLELTVSVGYFEAGRIKPDTREIEEA